MKKKNAMATSTAGIKMKAKAIPRLGVVLIVGAAMTFAAGGVFAMLTDTASLSGAEVASNDVTTANLDLKIKDGACADPGTFDDDAFVAVPDAPELDLNAVAHGTTPVSAVTIGTFCLQNAGDVVGSLSSTLLTRSSSERGACAPDEDAAEFALGLVPACDGAGELDSVATIDMTGCGLTGFTPAAAVGDSSSGTTLGAAATCEITIGASVASGAYTFDQYVAAETDLLAFDLAFDLAEVTGPLP